MSDYEETEEKQNEQNMALKIFGENTVDYSLPKEVGIQKALEYFMSLGLGFPESCTIEDLYFLVQQEAPNEDFSEKTYTKFFQSAFNIIQSTVVPNAEEEDAYELTYDFVADRLSDLQSSQDDEFNFQFTSFIVSSAQIADVVVLKQFKSLKTIELKANMISDISPLTELPNLIYLDLSENKVFAIGGLNFPRLETLRLSVNQINYLDHFDAPCLKTLDLASNHIFFISPLSFSGCPQLAELNLSTNAIRTVKENAFSGLKMLKSFKIDSNNFDNLDNIICEEMQSINDIDISLNHLSDISRLQMLKNLEVIDVHGIPINGIESFIPLKDLESLKYLYIYETPYANSENARLELIHYLKHLEEIDETAITYADTQDSEALFAEPDPETSKPNENEDDTNVAVAEEEEEKAVE